MSERVSARLRVTPCGSSTPAARRLISLRDAALSASQHGWPVLPGSVWRQSRYYNAITNASTNGLTPVVPRQHATVDRQQVRAWWQTLPHAVLLVTGKAFDVISVPMSWGISAAKHSMLRHDPAPMIVTPERMAHFLVTVPATLHVELPRWPRVVLAEPLSVVPAPPTRMDGNLVKWWITPNRTDWTPGDPALVQRALVATASGNAARET
ncbi:bifunctional DNA primase/polymerase [Kibdelosporangium philippinense]|uniref:Bifunctional DNA primase/polymerase n=1 Tax=Kibdelosporangium philippinense TaxID=211113 RepID=A0ABS8Z2T1_9PSEU|nr:bifunctional DNA primase/polymerase [Kibdelosporangium philippinense]MCE7002100.1 bifunctional DNA primase/polymerase [Kibdelosporangium philippinense]